MVSRRENVEGDDTGNARVDSLQGLPSIKINIPCAYSLYLVEGIEGYAG